MAQSPAKQPAAPPPAEATVRVRLARLSGTAALQTPGVLSLDRHLSGLLATRDGNVWLHGVVCAAEPNGRYGVRLYLCVRPVPLRELADEVRNLVEAAAAREGLREHLGAVDVEIRDVVAPEQSAL